MTVADQWQPGQTPAEDIAEAALRALEAQWGHSNGHGGGGAGNGAGGGYESSDGQDEDDEDDAAEGATWLPVDLADIVAGILDGTWTRPAPTVGQLTNGAHLFYLGRVNGVFGESGAAKSFLAQYIAGQLAAAGIHVVYLDYEDRADATVSRLLDMGVDPAAIVACFHYLAPDEPYGLAAAAQMAALISAYNPAMVVLDSTGESMAVESVKPNDDDAVARWGRRLPAAIARLGPAVVTVDHVTKDKETRGLYAIGSQRKRAAITGASYMVENRVEFAQHRAGYAQMTCAKDRGGTYIRGQRVAEFHVSPVGDGRLVVELRAIEPLGDGDTFRPTALMEKVSRWLELNPASSRNAVEKAKLGRKVEYVRDALGALIAEDHVEAIVGPRGAQLHRVTVPYRRSEDPLGAVDEHDDMEVHEEEGNDEV